MAESIRKGKMLDPNEIFVGLVCSLDSHKFAQNHRIFQIPDNINSPGTVTRPGPFVCVGISGSDSQWAEITTQDDEYKLIIRKEWRSGVGPDWDHKKKPRWLHDVQSIHGAVFQGPTEEFALLSESEAFPKTARRVINPVGIIDILAFLKKRGCLLFDYDPSIGCCSIPPSKI